MEQELQQICDALEAIGELLDAIDRGYGDRAWERIDRQSTLVKKLVAALPAETRRQLPRLRHDTRALDSLHACWATYLNEVKSLMTHQD